MNAVRTYNIVKKKIYSILIFLKWKDLDWHIYDFRWRVVNKKSKFECLGAFSYLNMKRHCKRWIECTFRVKMQHFAFDIQLLSAVCSCVKSNLHYRFELLEIISAILCSLSLWNLNSWQAPDLISRPKVSL